MSVCVCLFVCLSSRREGGEIGLFITLVPKFLFVGLTTLGTFLIGWLFKLCVQTFQPLIYRRDNLVYDHLHQFFGYCLIPLDPWSVSQSGLWLAYGCEITVGEHRSIV